MNRTRPSVRSIARQLNAARSVVAVLLFASLFATAQNSMIGDGFGGRLWYRPTNYAVGSYSAYSLCYSDPCDSSSTQLFGWGADYYNQLGNGPGSNHSDVPVLIPDMDSVHFFTSGYWTGAIKNNGTGWVWREPDFLYPTQMVTGVKFVDAGAYFLSFVKQDGTVWSIGNNEKGQFGDGTQISSALDLVQMNGVTNAVRVACVYSTTVVLLADSTLLTVGDNVNGQLGDPANADSVSVLTIPVSGLSGIVDVKAHAGAVAALASNGDVYCWGWGGHTGDGDQFNDTLPKLVQGLANIVAISGCSDGIHFLALDAYQNCYSWGEYNQIGSWDFAPVLVATDVIDIMAGESFSYIVKSAGSLWASGRSIVDGASLWLDLPDVDGNLDPIFRSEFVQINPALVSSACAVVGTVAVPRTACDGTNSVTVSHFGGLAPYQFDIGSGPQSSNVFTEVPLGNYTVSVTDANGCVITVPCEVVSSSPAPILVDMGTVIGCVENGYILPSGTTVFTSGTYTDTTFSTLGCDTVGLYYVAIESLQYVYWQGWICLGGTFTLPNGGVVSAPGVYYDTVAFAGVCDTIYSFNLLGSLDEMPLASISAQDTIVTAGQGVALFAAGGLSYAWEPPNALSCIYCPNPIATPTETTNYCVVVSNLNNCVNDTACIKITVVSPSIICTAENIFIPTAFSPNASGQNDAQCVFGADCISNMLFQIFDRWGNKVFESTNPKACWDGTYKGQALDPAVFVYHLSATMINGDQVERQGNISLIR